jgi:hypothetical protein
MSIGSFLKTSTLAYAVSGGDIVDTTIHRMTGAMPSRSGTMPQKKENLLSQNLRPVKRSLQVTLPAEKLQQPLDKVQPTTTTTTNVTNDDEELLFDLYESPCFLKASNDAFNHQDYQEFGLMCNETFFGGCNYDNMTALQQDLNSKSVVHWIVVFDYEVYFTGDPIPAAYDVETIILEQLSEIAGLNGCTTPKVTSTASRTTNHKEEGGVGGLTIDNGYRRRQMMEYMHDFSEEELSIMMAISSENNNKLDPHYSECIEEIF